MTTLSSSDFDSLSLSSFTQLRQQVQSSIQSALESTLDSNISLLELSQHTHQLLELLQTLQHHINLPSQPSLNQTPSDASLSEVSQIEYTQLFKTLHLPSALHSSFDTLLRTLPQSQSFSGPTPLEALKHLSPLIDHFQNRFTQFDRLIQEIKVDPNHQKVLTELINLHQILHQRLSTSEH